MPHGSWEERAVAGGTAWTDVSKVDRNIAGLIHSRQKGNCKKVSSVVIVVRLNMYQVNFPRKGGVNRFDFMENITVGLNGFLFDGAGRIIEVSVNHSHFIDVFSDSKAERKRVDGLKAIHMKCN